jgi:hypothetical protein
MSATLARRRPSPYAAALVAVVALAGCAADPPAHPVGTKAGTRATAGTVTPSAATPTTSPAASTDPVIAKIPAAARPETMEGAAAFAKYYFGQLNQAFRAGDPRILNQLALPSCATCSAFSEAVNSLEGKGRTYGGDLVIVRYATALEFTPQSRRVLVDLSQQAVPILDRSGKKIDQTPTGKAAFVATLTYRERWVIRRLQKAPS